MRIKSQQEVYCVVVSYNELEFVKLFKKKVVVWKEKLQFFILKKKEKKKEKHCEKQ